MFIKEFIQKLDFARFHTTVPRGGQFPNEEADSLQEPLFDIVMHSTKKVPNRSAEQNFIRQQRLQIRGLLQPFMAANVCAVFATKKERHLPLRQMGALAVRAYVIV